MHGKQGGSGLSIAPRCQKRTVLKTCPYNEDSDQPELPRSLIRVFVVRRKTRASLAIQNAPSEDSDQTARIRGLI